MSVISKTPNPASRFCIAPNGSASDARLRGARLHVWLLYREQAPGFNLPPETAAKRLHLGLATVKRALRGLEADRLIVRHRTRLPNGMWGPSTVLVRGIHDIPADAQTPSSQPQLTGRPPQPPAEPDPRAPAWDEPDDEPRDEPPAASTDAGNPRSEPQLIPPPVVDRAPYKTGFGLQDDNPAPDARRATDVSARAGAGGCAAPDPIPPVEQPPRPVPAEYLRRVIEALPRLLRAALPRGPLPRTVLALIAEQLGVRSLAQLIERIRRRWVLFGYEIDADPAAGGRGLRSPIGVLTELLRHGRCPDPRCEDGASVDTGKPCARCDEQRAARMSPAQPVQDTDAPTGAHPGPHGRPAARYAPQQPAPVHRDAPGAGAIRIYRAGPAPGAAPASFTRAPAPSWLGCPAHPGAGKRFDPATGARVCAGCWSSRFDPDDEERTAA